MNKEILENTAGTANNTLSILKPNYGSTFLDSRTDIESWHNSSSIDKSSSTRDFRIEPLLWEQSVNSTAPHKYLENVHVEIETLLVCGEQQTLYLQTRFPEQIIKIKIKIISNQDTTKVIKRSFEGEEDITDNENDIYNERHESPDIISAFLKTTSSMPVQSTEYDSIYTDEELDSF